MPEPPLLLADRVTGIDAVPGSMGKGTLWTETDVLADSWYLDDEGRMPAGIMIESGQADLLLISWLGIDSLIRANASIACSAATSPTAPACRCPVIRCVTTFMSMATPLKAMCACFLPLRLQGTWRNAIDGAQRSGRLLH